MRKALSLILAGLILAGGMLSCAQTDVEQENAETEETAPTAEETIAETEPSYLDTLEAKNFDGASYVISTAQQGSIPAFAVELTGEVVNDALYERDLKVSDIYNVAIEYIDEQDPPNTAKNVINCVLAGDYYSDLYMDALSDGRNYMSSAFRSGALYNLMDVPHLKLDESWWSKLLYENLQYKGKLFFTSGDFATASYYAPACVFMNVAVANDNHVDVNEMYQLVYEGTWTVDEMMKRTNGLNRDLNGDGFVKLENDAFGVINATVELTATEICVGAGIRYCNIDDAGNLVVNLNTEHVLTALEKLQKCFCEVKPTDDYSFALDTIKSDRTLFYVHFVGTAISMRDMESDFIILPMAKYDEAQESYMSYTNPHSLSYLAIPLIQPDIERTGFITEVLEYLSVEMVRPAIYDVTLKGKVAREPNTQAMLDLIFNTTYIDFNALTRFGGSTDVVSRTLFSGADFVSGYKRVEKLINKELEIFETFFE